MKEIERGSTLVFVTGNDVNMPDMPTSFENEFGVKLLFITEKADLIGIVPPEPPRPMVIPDIAIAKDSVFTSDRALTNEERSVGVALGVAPVTDIDDDYNVNELRGYSTDQSNAVSAKLQQYRDAGDQIVSLLKDTVKVKNRGFSSGGRRVTIKGTVLTSFVPAELHETLKSVMTVDEVDFVPSTKAIVIKGSLVAELKTDHGFTYSAEASKEVIDFIIMNADLKAYQAQDFYRKLMVHIVPLITVEPDTTKYYIGDETRKQVFEPWLITDMSDLQRVLDAVEIALASPTEIIDQGATHREAGELHDIASEKFKAYFECPKESKARDILHDEFDTASKEAVAITAKTGLVVPALPNPKDPFEGNMDGWHNRVARRHHEIAKQLTLA